MKMKGQTHRSKRIREKPCGGFMENNTGVILHASLVLHLNEVTNQCKMKLLTSCPRAFKTLDQTSLLRAAQLGTGMHWQGRTEHDQEKRNNGSECVRGIEIQRSGQRKESPKDTWCDGGDFRVFDGALSKEVDIFTIWSMKAVGCSSNSLLVHGGNPQAFDKASPPCLYTFMYLH